MVNKKDDKEKLSSVAQAGQGSYNFSVEIQVSRSDKQRLCEDIVIVDGLSTSGKSLLAPVMSSWERSELWLLDHSFEYLCALDYLGKISPDGAQALANLYADTNAYNLSLGRNTNFRALDLSSVQANLLEEKYIARQKLADGAIALQRMQAEKPILFLMTHYIFGASNLLFEAFHDRLKAFLMTTRHPWWVIESWFNNGFTNRIGKDPREFHLCFDETYPWFTAKWKDQYAKSNDFEKAVRTTAFLMEMQSETFRKLDSERQKKVLFIPYENFLQEPDSYFKRIQSFLKTSDSAITSAVLAKVGLPRRFDKSEIEVQKDKVLTLATVQKAAPEVVDLALKIAKDYESKFLNS